MIKRLLIAVALSCAVSAARAQVPVTSIVQPRVTFVDAQGGPCVGCKLYTYTAGTTTAFPTYTDSTGSSQNTNPIILDASGGAFIWVGRTSYKFILKTSLDVTIWSVDNVNEGNLFPCGPAGSVQFSNIAVTGMDCDAAIYINKTNHTLNVGTIGTNHVVIGALSTPTLWTFDTSTPATALASLGGAATNPGTAGQIAVYAATGNVVSGTSAIPNGITASTQAINDNSAKVATTAYVKTPGAINPSGVQIASGVSMVDNQGTGTKVQHSTGSTVTDNCVKFDAGGNTVDSGITCGAGAGTDYFFSFTGCTLTVTGNSVDCRASQNFSSVSPVVPTQPDANYYIGCSTYTTQDWGSSTGINNVTTTGFTYVQNVDRYNGVSATITPTVWCHLHHN
jgi:hypothetical protein